MTFSDFIKSLVEQTSYDFGRGERQWQNFLSDNQLNPAVYLDDPIGYTFQTTRSGGINPIYDLKLIIFHKSQLDWTPEQHDSVVELANQEARKLVILINNSESVENLMNVQVLEFHNLFDSNVSGVFLTGKITFRENASICVNATPQSDFVQLSNTNNEWQRTIPNGTSYIVPNTPIELIDSEGTIIETVNIPSVSGGQIVVTVGGSITVTNSSGTYSHTSSVDFVTPDITALVLDTDGNVVNGIETASVEDINLVAPDGLVTITNSTPTTIGTQSVMSNQSVNYQLQDTTYIFTVDGIAQAPFNLPTLENQIINVVWE